MEEDIVKRAKEKGRKYARQYHHNTCTEVSEPFVYSNEEIELACIEMATEQKAIYKELIDMLLDELYTSRAYHLGITGLDSDQERRKKEKEGDCALIRGIDRTIRYVKQTMEE